MTYWWLMPRETFCYVFEGFFILITIKFCAGIEYNMVGFGVRFLIGGISAAISTAVSSSSLSTR